MSQPTLIVLHACSKEAEVVTEKKRSIGLQFVSYTIYQPDSSVQFELPLAARFFPQGRCFTFLGNASPAPLFLSNPLDIHSK